MKILFLSKYYENYLEYFYSVNNITRDSSYNNIYKKIIEDRYFWSDYFKQELPAYGYEVEQLIIDAKLLQTQWAVEHKVTHTEDDWYFNILIEQIKYYKPEILFIQDWSRELGSDFILLIKSKCPSIRIVVGYCGEGHPSPGYFKSHDIIISCAKDNVELFKDYGLSAYHIYHAFHSDIIDQLGPKPEKTSELAFIGRIYPTSIFHRQRAEFLGKLSEDIPFAIHGEIRDAYELSKYQPLKSFLYRKIMGVGDALIDYNKFSEIKYIKNYLNYKEAKSLQTHIMKLRNLQKNQFLGLKMFDTIRTYKMLLNYHSSPRVAANLRMFEVTGMGACLITDWKENICEIFEPDKEIITFRNVDEAKEKIRYLKNNPDVIESISRAGQKRTIRDHTYKKRAQDMHNIFSDYLKTKAI
jgi:spore maturation protein CgeB